MSEIERVVIRTEHADGSVREYNAHRPAGLTVRFTEDGGVEAQGAKETKPLVFSVLEVPRATQPQ